jgi:hypothetical protein
VIGEDVAVCPKCGAPNEGHKPSIPRMPLAIAGGLLILVGVHQGWPWYGPALVLAGIGLAARQRSGPTRE